MSEELQAHRLDFYRKMERLLNVSPNSVHGGQELNFFKSWDSLTILEFIVLADEDYQSDVKPVDITACKTIDDLADLAFLQRAPSDSELLSGKH